MFEGHVVVGCVDVVEGGAVEVLLHADAKANEGADGSAVKATATTVMLARARGPNHGEAVATAREGVVGVRTKVQRLSVKETLLAAVVAGQVATVARVRSQRTATS